MSESVFSRPLTDTDHAHLNRCVELARESLENGGEPFGSVLVDASGIVRFEDRNRTEDGDATRHPEFEIARWAAANMTPEERVDSVTYTSGEHCAMCSAAHAWVGLGPIVYATSSAQLREWLTEWGVSTGPTNALAINEVAPSIPTIGPVPEFAAEVRALHAQLHGIV